MIDRRGQVWYFSRRGGDTYHHVVLIVGGPKDLITLSRGDERWSHVVVNLQTGKLGKLFDGTEASGISLDHDPDLKRLA